jgi:ketosteroid isomerase-like protein
VTRSTDATGADALARRHFAAMTSGSLDDLRAVVHPDARNREAVIEPPACRGTGPEAWQATSRWLHDMSSDLSWEVHEVVASGDLIAVHATMRGHHTGDHTRYDAAGRLVQVIRATGRAYRVTQSHWLRVRDGLVVEHWANRDDLGMAVQLGWVPGAPAEPDDAPAEAVS